MERVVSAVMKDYHSHLKIVECFCLLSGENQVILLAVGASGAAAKERDAVPGAFFSNRGGVIR